MEEFYTVRCQVADMKNLYVSPPNVKSVPVDKTFECSSLLY